LFDRGGSAAGPKPGRDGFSVELAGPLHIQLAMAPCVTHLYTGVLPCPWPDCTSGIFHDSFEHLGKQITRECFHDVKGVPIYSWAIDTISSAYTFPQFARRSILNLHAEDLPDESGDFYHFTSADGLRGILASGELWLTDYRDFADKEEIRNGLSLLNTVIANPPLQLHPTTRMLLDALLDDPLDEPIYVVCFCWLAESPHHWQEYARDETGGAIVLDPFGFRSLLEADIFGIQLVRVAYTWDSKEPLFREMAWWLDKLVRFDIQRRVFDRRSYLRELRQLLGEMLPMCKDVSFLKEHEMRIIVSPALSRQGLNDHLPTRELHGRRYITTRDICPNWRLPVTEVIVGDRFEGDPASLLPGRVRRS
jgi:hypothetical protein